MQNYTLAWERPQLFKKEYIESTSNENGYIVTSS